MVGMERRLLDLAYAVGRADNVDELRRVVAAGVGAVIGCDLASYTEVWSTSEQVVALLDQPVDLDRQGGVQRLGELAHQHPLITRDRGDAESISDYLSERAFKRLELHRDVYDPLGAADQMAITVKRTAEVTIGVALNRSRVGFSASERAALNALAPVIRRGLQRAEARERGRELLAELELESGAAGAGVVALNPGGVIEFASDRAWGWLRAYFPGAELATLPPGPAQWLAGPAPESLMIQGARGTLELRTLPANPGEPRLLELRERRLSPVGRLTAREREVLDRVAQGASNQDIAMELRVSRRTIEHHLQAVYRKLGVSRRTAAVARLHEPD